MSAATATLIRCPDGVLAGALITKEGRHDQFGTIAGGAGSRKPEEFQRAMVVEGTGAPCAKTHMRINLRTNRLREVAHPNTERDGFDYSEDFDGVQRIGGKTVYLNFKCIVGKGGSQTRSLREVYWFVEGQLKYALSAATEPVYFANILDGDEAHAVMPKFAYILGLPEFESVRGRVYVGDLRGYFAWVAGVIAG
jgi:hypothetical protein